MSIAKPGPVIRRWSVTGLSMNGQTEYGLQIEAMLEATAREMFRTYVIQHVRSEHGVTPAGVPWLVDPRTIEVKEVSR